jgi:polysaccharide export outer membrane protein
VIDVVPCRFSAVRRVFLPVSRSVATMACLFAVAGAPYAARAQFDSPAAANPQSAQATPQTQIITVPAPTPTPANAVNNGTNWSRGSNQAAPGPANRSVDQNRAADIVDVPSEFQRLVQTALGQPLPIFGAELFRNPPSTFAPIEGAQITPDYVIGAGDEIRLSATGQLNQQGSFTVDRAGTISIPDVGTLTVAGLRFSELRPFLRQQIGRVYRNFDLNVTLGQLRSIQIYILGEARQPGAYTVSSLSTLVNALFASGGVRPEGSLRHIELRRGGRTITDLDLYDLLLRGDKAKDVALQPGDIIFVPAAGPQVAITGSVTTPAIYELRGETTINQLLQLANGLTSTANATRVRVESITGGASRSIQNVSLQTAGDLPLHAGDIISIESISDQFKDAITLRGNVANPGRYGWHAGMRVSDLIPNRESLITRDYFRSRNALGQPTPNFQSAPTVQATQGRIAVSTPGAGNSPVATPATTSPSAARTDAPSASSSNTASSNGGGSTVGEALTQNNGTFAATTDVLLSAADVDLAYAVIERLDQLTLTTSLIPFNLGAVVNGTDPTQNLALLPGDVVTIFSKADIRVPQSQQTRFVRLEGEFTAAGVYSVRPGETLRQLITRAGGLTSEAYLYASEFTRQSTRRVEQQRLREYADSLDAQISSEANRQIAGALDPAGTAQTANIAADNARAAVQRLRSTQPTGRIVLKLSPDSAGIENVPDLALEDGDRFIIPRQPSSITVAGEVYNASAFLFEPHLQVRNYVRDAGGPSRNADSKRIFVIRADGSVVSRQYADVVKAPSLPGDTVVVPPQLVHGSVFRNIVAIANAAGQLALPLSLIALIR